MTYALPVVGDNVAHPVLGKGVVTNVRGARGGDHDISIRFDGSADVKVLMWSFTCAKLRVTKRTKRIRHDPNPFQRSV